DVDGLEFTEGDNPTELVTAATISDEDSSELNGATISLVDNPDAAAEVLAVDTSNTSITDTFENGVLTLSGAASVAEYEQVLRTLTYSNTSQNPTGSERTVNVVVRDESDSPSEVRTASLMVTPVNDAPTLESIDNLTASFGEMLEITVTAADPDDSTLTFGLEGVNLPDTATITPNADGVSAVIRYQPNMDDGFGPLEFIVTVSDEDPTTPLTASEMFVLTIDGGSDPVVDLNGEAPDSDFAAGYQEGSPAELIVDPGLTVEDADSTTLASATITLTNPQDGNAESLSIDTSNTSISPVAYDPTTGVLSLIGVAPVSECQQVLRSLRYQNTSQDPTEGDRVVSVVVSDGASESATVNSTVTVTAVNDSPDLSFEAPFDGSDTPAFVLINQPIDITAMVNDPDHDNYELFFRLDLKDSGISPGSAQPTITSAPNDNPGGQFSWTPDETGTFVITVIVTDALGGVDQETFTVEVIAPTATWINPDGGAWNVAANWEGGEVPDADDIVYIGPLNSDSEVFVNSVEEVAGILLDDSLRVTSGALTAGEINIGDGEFTLASGILRDTEINAASPTAVSLESLTLDNVTLNADATINPQRTVTVVNGLTVNADLTLAGDSGVGSSLQAALRFNGTQTLDGTGRVVFSDQNESGTQPANNLLTLNNLSNDSETLTIGADIELIGESGSVSVASPAQDNIVLEGTLTVVEDGDLTISAIQNDGSIVVAGDLNGTSIDNRGLLDVASTGIVNLSEDYNQSAAGRYRVGIAGLGATDFGRLVATGTVDLAGEIVINHENGFQPAVDDAFALIEFGSLNGAFDTIDDPDGTTYELVSDADSLDARVTGVTQSSNSVDLALGDL
ncbi:MAG: hypothetical protein AAGA92_13225, partial [Planctomycetota bacterium]